MSALVDVSVLGKRDIDKLFDSFAGGGSGSKAGELNYNDLNRALRSGNTVELKGDLKTGAMGKIETESKNKTSVRSGRPAGGPKIGKLAPRPPSQSARGPGAPRHRASAAPPANNGASSARAASGTDGGGAADGGRPQSRGRGDVPHALVDPRSGLDGRPDTAPSASGGRATSPLEGWGFGGDGLASVSGVSSTSRVSRPVSRAGGGGSVSGGSSYRGKRGGGSGSRSDLGDARSDFGSLKSGFGMPSIDPKDNMRRAAGVYLQGPAQRPGASPRRMPGRHPSPRIRGLPSLTEDGSRRGSGWEAGGGIGSREELEAALAQAQTALVMAKERISMLEQQNALLRSGQGGGRGGASSKSGAAAGVAITKEKYMEANQLLREEMITEGDFAAIKAKYMQDSFGI